MSGYVVCVCGCVCNIFPLILVLRMVLEQSKQFSIEIGRVFRLCHTDAWFPFTYLQVLHIFLLCPVLYSYQTFTTYNNTQLYKCKMFYTTAFVSCFETYFSFLIKSCEMIRFYNITSRKLSTFEFLLKTIGIKSLEDLY